MNASLVRVPSAVPGDPNDVAVALEVAAACWEKGDTEEAIHWVQRASDVASEAGDSGRAAVLALGRLDLEQVVRGSAPRQQGDEAIEPAVVQAIEPPARVEASTESAEASSTPVEVPPTAVELAPAPINDEGGSSRPPSSSSPMEALPPRAEVMQGATPARSGRSIPPPLPRSRASSRPPTIPPARGSSPDQSKPVASAFETSPGPSERAPTASIGERRLRVFVRFSVRDPQLYVVRPLADGVAPPPGTQEAVLTFVGPEPERLQRFNGAPCDE
jgi:hypothetical protein